MVIPLGQIGRYATELCDRYTSKGNRNIGMGRTELLVLWDYVAPCWYYIYIYIYSRSQWSQGLRHGSAFSRLLGLRVLILQGHGCLPLVSVLCCQVEFSASGWSLVQRSPTECVVSECNREASIMRRPYLTRGCCAMEKKNIYNYSASETPPRTDKLFRITNGKTLVLHGMCT